MLTKCSVKTTLNFKCLESDIGTQKFMEITRLKYYSNSIEYRIDLAE